MQFKKILVVRLDRLGDMVLTLPAIKVLKDSFPESELSILCQPFLKEFLLTQPYIDKVYSYTPKSQFIQTYRLFKRLRKEKFDLAVDFIYAKSLRPAFFTFLSGAKKRIGFNTGIRSAFFTDKVNKTKQLKYEVERNLDIIRALNLNVPRKFELTLNSRIIKKLQKKFPFLKKRPIICLHPGIGKQDKKRQWDTKKFAELSKKLVKKYKAEIIITGTIKEENLVKKIISESQVYCHNFAGKTTIEELCALIFLSDLVICTLTGVTHLGVSLNKPTIALCGPTPTERWTNEKYIILRKNLACSPCEQDSICSEKNNFCMTKITVKEVFQKVEKIIN